MTILPRSFLFCFMAKTKNVFTGISDCCKKHSTIYLFRYEKTSEKYRIGIDRYRYYMHNRTAGKLLRSQC